MNFMGKLFGPGKAGGGAGMADSSQDHSLHLMHLRKLFGEFRHPPPGTSQKELEDRLYNMLPLFCKVNQSVLYCITYLLSTSQVPIAPLCIMYMNHSMSHNSQLFLHIYHILYPIAECCRLTHSSTD